eukprot:TRINITY_DN5282_c0_g1_i1.p1 TRINITY_DN5282_c0_g1~~TRINITY_DN5282_c0_g1_i1.p1  ORF type:complete len:109 (+),score=41.30 TRINITY_DN5282_c0_g1_i1:184-510(+)
MTSHILYWHTGTLQITYTLPAAFDNGKFKSNELIPELKALKQKIAEKKKKEQKDLDEEEEAAAFKLTSKEKNFGSNKNGSVNSKKPINCDPDDVFGTILDERVDDIFN